MAPRGLRRAPRIKTLGNLVVPDEPIPKDVQAFLDAYIESVPQLELLCLLSGQAEQHWSIDELAHRIYVTTERAQGLLAPLVRGGLIEATGAPVCYRYAPKDADVGQLVDRTAKTYARELIAVSRYLHGRLLPTTDLAAFADAFRLKKEAKDGDR